MGSCRACCSEPRVGRGARAARVGTPRAPGPGRVQVRPPSELPPAPAPAPAPARAPRSAAAWGGSERSEQRAREGGGTEGGRELVSELWSRAGEEREGAAAKPGWGSFFQRTGRRWRSAPAAAQRLGRSENGSGAQTKNAPGPAPPRSRPAPRSAPLGPRLQQVLSQPSPRSSQSACTHSHLIVSGHMRVHVSACVHTC